MNWKIYTGALLLFNLVGFLFLYLLLRLQHILPLNPLGFGPVTPDLSFNTAVSFTTNTNWQSYGGETTMSHLSQMLGLTVQNFLSAATGMVGLVALIRGLVRHTTDKLGNFWVDLTRSTLYILLPLALLLALGLVSQGVVQTFQPYETAQTLDQSAGTATQTLPLGPVASQIAIKQLGTNGGGYFNVNSAHPYENATPLSNFLEMLSILLIPAALTYTFGKMIGDTRQGCHPGGHDAGAGDTRRLHSGRGPVIPTLHRWESNHRGQYGRQGGAFWHSNQRCGRQLPRRRLMAR
jgi:K+-transporting ATPase ATPase A chain